MHFLWIIRIPKDDKGLIVDVAQLLPEGFMERTKYKGLACSSSAPQPHILTHPTVKGFLTHCGWNSIMESIAKGVPIIGWPNHADQMINCKLCVEILNIMIPVQRMGKLEEIIGQNEVKKVVQLLIEDANIFHSLKRNVEELSELMARVCALWRIFKSKLGFFC